MYVYVRQIAIFGIDPYKLASWFLSRYTNTFLRLPPITLCSYSTNRRKSLFYVVSLAFIFYGIKCSPIGDDRLKAIRYKSEAQNEAFNDHAGRAICSEWREPSVQELC